MAQADGRSSRVEAQQVGKGEEGAPTTAATIAASNRTPRPTPSPMYSPTRPPPPCGGAGQPGTFEPACTYTDSSPLLMSWPPTRLQGPPGPARPRRKKPRVSAKLQANSISKYPRD